MFLRLCIGVFAFVWACFMGSAVIVFTIGDFVSKYPMPASAQLFAWAVTLVSAPVAYFVFRSFAKEYPGGVNIRLTGKNVTLTFLRNPPTE